MANILGALGALGSGFAGGMLQGRAEQRRQEDQAFERQQRERLVKQQQLADADTTLMREAGQQAQNVIQGYREKYEAPRAQQLLGGGTVDGPTTYTPSNEQILEAAKARRNYLIDKGRFDLALKLWPADEQFRQGLRADAAQNVRATLAGASAGSDVTDALQRFYGLMDDGKSIRRATVVNTEQGAPMVSLQMVDRRGKVEHSLVPPNTLVNMADGMSADPRKAAEFSLRSFYDLLKINEEGKKQKDVEGLKANNERELERLRQSGRMTLEGTREAGANARNAATTKATVDAAKIRSGGDQRRADTETIRALSQERVAADQEVNSLIQQLKDARSREKPALQQLLTEARQRQKGVRDRLAEVSNAGLEKRGLHGGGTDLPNGLPKGSVQIGTSNGKPVYRSPDGKQYVVD